MMRPPIGKTSRPKRRWSTGAHRREPAPDGMEGRLKTLAALERADRLRDGAPSDDNEPRPS